MSARLSTGGIEALHEVAQRHVGDERVPGIVVLVAHGDDVHVETLGKLSIGGPPVTRDSLFRIASTTKPLSAAVTLALVADGLIALDEPVDALLPELASRRVLMRMDGPLDRTVDAWRSITTRDLLTFTFGFGMSWRMFAARTPWPVVAADSRTVVEHARAAGSGAQAGPRHVDRASRQPAVDRTAGRAMALQHGRLGAWRAWSRARPAAPSRKCCARACWSRSACGIPRFWTSETQRLASQYRRAADGSGARSTGKTGSGAGRRRSRTRLRGCCRTVDDLLAFARMLLAGGGDGLLARELVEEMTSDQLSDRAEVPWRPGPGVLRRALMGLLPGRSRGGAFGWDGGFGARGWSIPAVTSSRS